MCQRSSLLMIILVPAQCLSLHVLERAFFKLQKPDLSPFCFSFSNHEGVVLSNSNDLNMKWQLLRYPFLF